MTKKDYWQTSSLKIKSQIKTRHSRAGFLDRHDAGILPERFSDIPKPDRHDAVRAFLERFQPAERLDEIREERLQNFPVFIGHAIQNFRKERSPKPSA